ncbi:MAG: LapA family protein [Syntrophomonadaceae bacterium]
MNAYLLAALFFIAAMLIFIFQNDTQVTVQFINWKTANLSLAIVVIASVCAGALTTFLLDSYRAFKTGQRMRKLVKENQKYEQEIKLLKGQPAAATGKNGVNTGQPDSWPKPPEV